MSGVARVEFRDDARRLLGYAQRDGDRWHLVAGSRRTVVTARALALHAGAEMADATVPEETPVPRSVELVALVAGWRATAADIDPGSTRAPNVLHDPGAMRAETLRQCAAEVEIAVEAAAEGGGPDGG